MGKQTTNSKTSALASQVERFVIRKPGTLQYNYENFCYLVEEDGKYLWGNREDAVVFDIAEAKKQQNMLAFETKLEGV